MDWQGLCREGAGLIQLPSHIPMLLMCWQPLFVPVETPPLKWEGRRGKLTVVSARVAAGGGRGRGEPSEPSGEALVVAAVHRPPAVCRCLSPSSRRLSLPFTALSAASG